MYQLASTLCMLLTHFRNRTSIQNQNLKNYGIHLVPPTKGNTKFDLRTLLSTTRFRFCAHGCKRPGVMLTWSSPITLDLCWPPHSPLPSILRRNCTKSVNSTRRWLSQTTWPWTPQESSLTPYIQLRFWLRSSYNKNLWFNLQLNL